MRALAALIALAAVLTGCGLLDRGASADPDSPLADQCGDVPDSAQRVTLEAADGRRLGAAVLGEPTATTGLVIVYGAGQTLCDWLDEADRVAQAASARVLVADRRGRGSSPGSEDAARWPADVVAGVTWLRAHGTPDTAVLGSSLGGPVALVAASPTGPRVAVSPPDPAAPVLDPPPCAAIGISPITSSGGGGGSVSVAAIETFPAPLWIAYEAGNGGIASGVRQIQADLAAVGAADQHILAQPGSDHSIGLVEKHPEVQRFVADAVRSCGR